jgi:hypothetical protein
MYFLTFHGQSQIDTEESAGAYINCYIQVDSLDEADKIARREIRKMNWNILSREDAYEINEDNISDAGRKYYEQALIDRTVYVFHTYPAVNEISESNQNDTAVFTTKFVIEDKKTITHVSHEIEDGAWQFFSDDKFDDFSTVARVVGLNEIISLDSTLKDLLDLEPGYIATRKSLSAKWKIRKNE